MALRTFIGRADSISAIVAPERSIAQMKRHAHRAVGARDHYSAGMALQKVVIAAAVEEHHALAAGSEISSESLHQLSREGDRIVALAAFVIRVGTARQTRVGLAPKIDHLDYRERAVVDT